MKELISCVVKSLCDHQDSVLISEFEGGRTTTIEIIVDKRDVGKIVGKGGKMIDAIRFIAMAVSSKTGRRVHLEIME